MYIVVAGAGLVGGDLAKKLADNHHDVVIVDKDKEVCDKLYAEAGVVAVQGQASSIEVLDEAGISKADSFVAATGSDTDNLASCLLAKSRGVPKLIARMRNESYAEAYKLAGVDSVIRVTDLMIDQMIIEIEQPDARKISSISHGKADIYAINIPQGASVAGKCVRDIAQNSDFPEQCNFIAINSKGNPELMIPRGDQVISEGDEIYLISPAEHITKAVDFLIKTD